jgi:thiamine kinase
VSPQQVAAEVLRIDGAGLAAQRIKGGLTNESWSVQAPHDAVVVRISTVDEQALQLNRASETVVLQLVQQAGIGAEVLLCAPERRLLVTRQLQAETLTAQAMSDPVIMMQLTALLRHLHALPVAMTIQQTNLLSILRGYWHSLDQRQLPRRESREVRAYATDIATESSRSATRCLCHNDVHHLNLMSDGQKLWLLDWEYAGIGDPFFDLAAVCCYHGYDPSLREKLLLAYHGTVLSAHKERLQRMCWLFDYIKVLWLAVRQLQADAV